MSLLAEWVDKAEADYQSAVALGRRRKAPLPDIVCSHDATLTKRLPLVQFLNPYAVLIRYPGMTATVVEAKEAVHALRRMRTILRRKLGMS